MSASDELIVCWQLGRSPRRPWHVSVRCPHGYPQVITSPSVIEGDTPFPTLHYLTCPWLVGRVARAESAGLGAAWTERLSHDDELASAMRIADAAYRAARARESGGRDACSEVSIGGSPDPLHVKCVHVHVAAALAGIADPVGDAFLDEHGRSCPSVECDRWKEGR